MKSPYPWPGGKSKIADAVWQRFGDVPNYVDPFFGSGAVLLSCPHERVHRKLPHLGDAGRGVHRKLLHLGDAGRGILEWFEALQERTRRVRVACGDWTRVLGPCVTWRHGTTAVFLDPPYDGGKTDYAAGSRCSADVRAWALENGSNPKLRIALCGYEGEHDMPPEWECLPWKARGGYGNQRKTGTNDNARKERIWFSPACLYVEDGLGLAVY